MVGVTRPDFNRSVELGVAYTSGIHEDDEQLVHDVWRATNESKKPVQVELRVRAPTTTSPGRYRTIESTSYAERDEQGNVTCVQGFFVDITSRKLNERLVEEKLQDALETKRATETFLDMLSHEMRNPL